MKKCLGILLLLPLLLSCNMVHRMADSAAELFGDEVVARVGEHKLHRSDLEAYIPAGVSAEDSLALALQYINTWAEDLLFLEMADNQLSKDEKDVSKELEEYRRTLLKYRYEESYINARLDTLISSEEIKAYYAANPEKFILERPILKVRYMIIPADSRQLKTLRSKMSSSNGDEVMEVDSLAVTAALRYVDSSDSWMDVITLAREFGTDYPSVVKAIKGAFIELPDEESGNLRLAYITDLVREGHTAPLDYCEDRIRDIILSARKHALVSSLERSLLEDARNKDKFVIY